MPTMGLELAAFEQPSLWSQSGRSRAFGARAAIASSRLVRAIADRKCLELAAPEQPSPALRRKVGARWRVGLELSAPERPSPTVQQKGWNFKELATVLRAPPVSTRITRRREGPRGPLLRWTAGTAQEFTLRAPTGVLVAPRRSRGRALWITWCDGATGRTLRTKLQSRATSGSGNSRKIWYIQSVYHEPSTWHGTSNRGIP